MMKAGIDLYCSKGTAEALKLTGHRLHIIDGQFHVGAWTILPFKTIHDAADPLGFLMAKGNERLVFATDTAYIPNRFAGLTHIMVEANHSLDLLKANTPSSDLRRSIIQNHMSLETVIDFLKANDLSDLQEIWLLHLSASNSDAQLFKRKIQETTGKVVKIA